MRFQQRLHDLLNVWKREGLQGCYQVIPTLLQDVASNVDQRASVLELRETNAEIMLDALQLWLDVSPNHTMRRQAIYLLVKLSALSQRFPSSLYIHNVDIGEIRDPLRWGGFADVFQGIYHGQLVALKKLKVSDRGKERMQVHRMFAREALVWRQLRHPNIMIFIGIDVDTFATTNAVCMVSPWMPLGTVIDFIKSSTYQIGIDRDRLMLEIACGIQYLHSQSIVHGDLRGANIFVSDDHHALLADFGLVLVGDATAGRLSTAMDAAGSVQWMCPERLLRSASGNEILRRTEAEDVYSFGCVCIEILTHQPPFYGLPDTAVIFKIITGQRPTRPLDVQCHGLPVSDDLWLIIAGCLANDSKSRSTISHALAELRKSSHEDHASKVYTETQRISPPPPGSLPPVLRQQNDGPAAPMFGQILNVMGPLDSILDESVFEDDEDDPFAFHVPEEPSTMLTTREARPATGDWNTPRPLRKLAPRSAVPLSVLGPTVNHHAQLGNSGVDSDSHTTNQPPQQSNIALSTSTRNVVDNRAGRFHKLAGWLEPVSRAILVANAKALKRRWSG